MGRNIELKKGVYGESDDFERTSTEIGWGLQLDASPQLHRYVYLRIGLGFGLAQRVEHCHCFMGRMVHNPQPYSGGRSGVGKPFWR